MDKLQGKAGIVLLLPLIIFLCGCWDKVEIEERGFVVGVGVDVAEEGAEAKGKFRLTLQFAVPSGLQGKATNGDKAFFNLTVSDNTMFQAIRNMSYMSSRIPYLQHNRLIIFSNEVAENDEFVKSIDLFLRDHEMRRATKVMVVEGKALELLELDPKNEKLPVVYFESVAQNPTKSSRIYPPTNIGDVQEYIIRQTSFALPRIALERNEVSVAGAAVFSGSSQKLLGFLSDDQTAGLNMLRGVAQDGVLEFKMDEEHMAFEIKGAKRKVAVDDRDPERLKFTINIHMEGNLGETQGELDLMNPNQLQQIEHAAEQQLLRLANSTLQKVQGEYASDVIGLGDYLRHHHHKIWERVRDDWDRGENLFARSTIEVNAKVKLRTIGSAIETQ